MDDKKREEFLKALHQQAEEKVSPTPSLKFREPSKEEVQAQMVDATEVEGEDNIPLILKLMGVSSSAMKIKQKVPLKEVPPVDVTGGSGDSAKGEITEEDREILRRLMEGKR
jgi:hypothetical protein